MNLRLSAARLWFISSSVAAGVFWGASAEAQPWQYFYDGSGNLMIRKGEGVAPPQILGQPQPQIVAPGELASFSVVMADTTACGYQWLFNGTNLTGQNGDALLILNVAASNEGLYSVIITNTSSSVTSSVAQLYLDSNGNGIPDRWELAYFGNLNQNATGDFDGDGISNLQEFLDGTNPTNRTSFRSRLTVLSAGGLVAAVPLQTSYAMTDTVSLTANPLPPNSFFGWTGDLVSRSNPAALMMNTNKTVRACFLCQPPVSGLVGWWRGETDASDFIGGHNGTFYSGTNVLAPSNASAGMVGSAFVFYGTNYIRVPDANDLRPPQFTIAAWVYPNVQNGNYQTVVAKGSAVNDDDTYYLGMVDGAAYFWTKHSGSTALLTGGAVPPNQWSQVAATFDGSTKSLYINGLLVAKQGGLGPLTYDPQTIPLTIGSDWAANAPAYLFNGLLDEVSLFNRPLTQAEITGLYIANCAGLCTNRAVFTSSPQFADATQGVSYTQQVIAALGTLPLAFTLSAGLLPPGLTLSTAGQVSGVPTAPGSNVFAVLATDAAGLSTEMICSLRVLPAEATPLPAMPAGLIGWWRAESNALDSVGTNNGAFRHGASFAPGKVGQAFSLDGFSNSVDIADSPTLRPASFTIEGWFLFTAVNGVRVLFAKAVGSSSFDSYAVWLENGTLRANIGDSAGSGPTFIVDWSPNLGQWYHVAFTFDDATKVQALYLNGAQVGMAYAGRSMVYDSHPMMLGRDDENGVPSFFFPGLIDEAALYNRALSPVEVAAIYNAGSAGKLSAGPYLNTPPLPYGIVGQGYTQTISSVRGSGTATYAISSGALPPGLTLTSGGLLEGTPATGGLFNFSILATDATAATNNQPFSIQVYTAIPPPAGLTGWWRAETNALDSAGTNDGVLRNGTGFAAGEVGQAFTLDGVSQSVDVADAPAVHPASVTLEAWVMFNSTAGLQAIFGKPLGSGVLDSYALYVSGGALWGLISDTNGFGPMLSAPFAPALGVWHHVAYTFDDAGKQQALYLDGAQVAAGVANISIGYDTQPMLLGRDIENGSPRYFFSGRIDEAAIYNRALGANEVAALFNAGPAGKAAVGPAFATPPVLPVAVVSQSYTQALTLARGTALAFAVVGGALPSGLALSSAGVLGGTPAATGTFSFVVRATDNASLTADQPFTLEVLPRVSPPAGLVGWWRAENNTIDSVGGNNGFLTNAATFALGKVGQAFSLNGVSAAVEIGDATALRPTSVTLEAWVMFFSSNGSQSIMAKTVGSGTGNSYALWLEGGNLKGTVSSITGANSPISVPFLPTLGQWYHVAFTFDDTTKQQVLYLDGVALAFGISNLGVGYDTHPVFLGGDVQNGSLTLFLDGRIDEASLYNRALSAAEIAAIYNADAAGKTTVGPYITTPPNLPPAAYGVGYTQTITSVRGTPSVTYAQTGGALPAGLTFNPQGVLSGVPTGAGAFSFTVSATDAAGIAAYQTFSLQVASPAQPPAGLVSWWRAENNALDSAGTNHGSALGGAGYAPGEVGQAFALDGVAGCILIPDSPSLRPASVTLEAWVRFDTANGVRFVLAKPLGAGTLDSYSLWLENGYLKGAIASASGSGPALAYPFTPTIEQWYHLAYTFDDSTRQQVLYLNNTTVASGAADRSIAYDDQPVLLGCDSDNGVRTWFLQGRIDEAALYNRALTAAEIASLYYAGPAGKSLLPLLVLRASVQGSLLSLSFPTALGVTYTVQSETSLSPGSWSVLTNISALTTNATVSFPITGSPQRFYRVTTTGH